jgi:hypothetical protein
MLSTCSTRSPVDDDVVRPGREPPPGAPWADHCTDHETVATTAKDASFGLPSGAGWPAEEA